MKFIVRVLLVVSLSVMLSSCGAKLPDALAPGYRVPFTRITFLDGNYDTLNRYKGQKVAILFWAKWCSKSRRAIGDFNSLAAASTSPAVFIAVSLDKFEDEDDLRRYLEAQHIDAPLLAFSGNGADDEAALAFRAFEIPIAFLVDENGVVQIATHDLDELAAGL